MVDAPRLSILLERISSEVAHLRGTAARADEDLLGDADALPAAKYRLIVAVEAATDAADHVIAAEGLRPSTSFADSFWSLAEGHWLEEHLASLLADAARFRNLLVHQYAEVDDRRVIEILRTRLTDLDRFVEVLAEHVRHD